MKLPKKADFKGCIVENLYGFHIKKNIHRHCEHGKFQDSKLHCVCLLLITDYELPVEDFNNENLVL